MIGEPMTERWYETKFHIKAPEGMTASELDMWIYRLTKHSNLEFDVEEIVSISEVEDDE